MATEAPPKNEKLDITAAPSNHDAETYSTKETDSESHEVFKMTTDGVNFRNVSWPRATIIFLKIIFATGVLSIPTAMYSLGAVGGALSVIGWSIMNTCEPGHGYRDLSWKLTYPSRHGCDSGKFQN